MHTAPRVTAGALGPRSAWTGTMWRSTPRLTTWCRTTRTARRTCSCAELRNRPATERGAVSEPEPLLVDLLTAPEDLALVGGKAANLGVLMRAGFPVPPGVCLTTVAYSRAVGAALDDVVADL